uniref:Macaca fascicularis brain cDNA clone: QflA-19216, similar to human similar to KIAA0738 protein (LOC402618), mRNA, RefSeq: XM_379954.1 n=1 Tax=Macaca fascicularis TaxID=9541 RepID=I7GN07_MACFA|nr:unnamed protein product [Macaca fascicularis]
MSCYCCCCLYKGIEQTACRDIRVGAPEKNFSSSGNKCPQPVADSLLTAETSYSSACCLQV